MRKVVRAALLAIVVLAAGVPADAAVTYRIPIWFRWTRATMDVVIVPPNHNQISNGNGLLGGGDLNELNPYAGSYLRAIEDSIDDWRRAVSEYGPEWLRTGLVINSYVLGRDLIPAETARAPEIIIVTDETKGGILGMATRQGPWCLVDNSKLLITSFTYQDMFSINSQEFGHCLGLSHTNEADPANPNIPLLRHDVMNGFYEDSIGDPDTHLHCVSSLDVAGLEEVYSDALISQEGASHGEINAAEYVRPAEC